MVVRRSSQIVAGIASIIALNSGIASVGLSQATLAEEATSETERTPDEIVVYGEKSLVILRNELYRAEESFFKVFNSLNSDNDFDVKCKKSAELGHRRRVHQCTPRFATRLAAQGVGGFFSSDMRHSDFANLEYRDRLRNKEKQMWAEMANLARENLVFREELKALLAANRALNAYEKTKHK